VAIFQLLQFGSNDKCLECMESSPLGNSALSMVVEVEDSMSLFEED